MAEIWENEYLKLVGQALTEVSAGSGFRGIYVSEEGEKPELVLTVPYVLGDKYNMDLDALGVMRKVIDNFKDEKGVSELYRYILNLEALI